MTRRQIPEGLHVRYAHERCTPEEVRANLEARAVGLNFQLVTRPRHDLKVTGASISPRGGKTTCYLEDGKRNTVAQAEARCSALDNFVHQVGRDISLGRVLKELDSGSE